MNASAETIVACMSVTKDFAGGDVTVRALRGVDVSIYSGQLTLLVGPSGCGKTTLISVIAGILTPTTGRCETLGKDLERLSARQRAKLRLHSIGFIFSTVQFGSHFDRSRECGHATVDRWQES